MMPLEKFNELMKEFILQSRELSMIRSNLAHTIEMVAAAERVIEFHSDAKLDAPTEVLELLHWAEDKNTLHRLAAERQSEILTKLMLDISATIKAMHSVSHEGVH